MAWRLSTQRIQPNCKPPTWRRERFTYKLILIKRGPKHWIVFIIWMLLWHHLWKINKLLGHHRQKVETPGSLEIIWFELKFPFKYGNVWCPCWIPGLYPFPNSSSLSNPLTFKRWLFDNRISTRSCKQTAAWSTDWNFKTTTWPLLGGSSQLASG